MMREFIAFKGDKDIWNTFTSFAKMDKKTVWEALEPLLKKSNAENQQKMR